MLFVKLLGTTVLSIGDAKNNTNVAVKIPNKRKDKKWMNQLRIQAALDIHPNIVRLYGFRYTSRFDSLIFEITEENLTTFVTNEKLKGANETYFDSIRKITRGILHGMVSFKKCSLLVLF